MSHFKEAISWGVRKSLPLQWAPRKTGKGAAHAGSEEAAGSTSPGWAQADTLALLHFSFFLFCAILFFFFKMSHS